jgi:hypothetical protein
MRIVALIASHNERRFIESCLRHLDEHGVHAYLIDNESTDRTVELAEPWLKRNLLGIEAFPRPEGDTYDWRGVLRRKEELASELEADWFIHLDPDEVRLPPHRDETLADALERADAEGYTAVNFNELTFMPTREEPDHDHPGFEGTLRTYYPFEPCFPHHLNAWKAQSSVALAGSGGHIVDFPGLCAYPRSFPMKHYLFLSVPHAIEKYVERRYRAEEVASGWHGWRSKLTPPDIRLPNRSELRVTRSDDDLDPRDPRPAHYLDQANGLRV